MEKLIVDRIVGEIAVLEKEDRSHVEVPLSEIAVLIKEGSVLRFDGVAYTADEDSEALRRKKIFEMQQKLRNRG